MLIPKPVTYIASLILALVLTAPTETKVKSIDADGQRVTLSIGRWEGVERGMSFAVYDAQGKAIATVLVDQVDDLECSGVVSGQRVFAGDVAKTGVE